MRTKKIYSNRENHPGYGAGEGDTERYEYLCPCGKGRVIEEHDNIPGFREHDVEYSCAVKPPFRDAGYRRSRDGVPQIV